MLDRLEADVGMLARHLRVLDAVRDNEPIGIRKLAEATGIPNHKVRYSLRKLQDENAIEPTPKGAGTTEWTEGFAADVDDALAEIAVDIEHVREIGRFSERKYR